MRLLPELETERQQGALGLLAVLLIFIAFCVFMPQSPNNQAIIAQATIECESQGGQFIQNPNSWLGQAGGIGCSLDYEARDSANVLEIAAAEDRLELNRRLISLSERIAYSNKYAAEARASWPYGTILVVQATNQFYVQIAGTANFARGGQ